MALPALTVEADDVEELGVSPTASVGLRRIPFHWRVHAGTCIFCEPIQLTWRRCVCVETRDRRTCGSG